MAYPRRDPDGMWSLNQIAAAAHISYRTARTLVSNEILDPRSLTAADIAVARVAAALLSAPRTGQEAGRKRMDEALRVTRAAIAAPSTDPEATLLVLPDRVEHAPKVMALLGLIPQIDGELAILVPLGAWVTQARHDALAPRSPAGSSDE